MAEVNVLREKIRAVLPDIRELKHQLHQIPEIAFKEYKTSAKIREYLEQLGLQLLPTTLGTDVTALLVGENPGPVVLVRSDIDALPIEEGTGLPYASVHPGFSHACGHDGHMATVLGVAAVLSKMKDQIKGTVKFLFQPAEESDAGAKSLVEAGYLEQEPKPDEAYSFHGWPGIPFGTVECCTGPIMANTDDFEITINGGGGHGAMPEKAVDLVEAASRFILDMKQCAKELNTPESPAVISVCSAIGGSTFNVFPEKVVLKGTSRYLIDETGSKIKKAMRESLDRQILSIGARYNIATPKPDYVSVDNDKDLFQRAASVASKYLGKEKWNGDGVCSMCGDDFGFITRKIKSLYFHLGMGEESPSLHNPAYIFKDEALESAILMMCGLVLER
jgi:amidohydrolase